MSGVPPNSREKDAAASAPTLIPTTAGTSCPGRPPAALTLAAVVKAHDDETGLGQAPAQHDLAPVVFRELPAERAAHHGRPGGSPGRVRPVHSHIQRGGAVHEPRFLPAVPVSLRDDDHSRTQSWL